MIRKRPTDAARRLGVVHAHRTALRPLAFDLERARGRGRRRLARVGLVLLAVAIAGLVILAVR